MPWWHQKNSLCYNSRLTEQEFECVIVDYCRGISAKQSSLEIEERLGVQLSRQTISNYFMLISKCVLDYRSTYSWWSVEHWRFITELQMNEIRDAVYGHENILSLVRADFLEVTGETRSADLDTHFKILREMSKSMNGLPKKNFWVHLGRACEIAFFINEGHDDPEAAMCAHIFVMFESGQWDIFERKESPTTRAEQEKFMNERGNIVEEPQQPKEGTDILETEQDQKLREEQLKKSRLTVFKGGIEELVSTSNWRTK